jgi:CubicO group peptidase (beta-lactamase class C family)
MIRKILPPWCLMLGLVCVQASQADFSGRPDGLTLANFQVGPHNRWAFSHIREIIPTVNIAHDDGHVLRLVRSAEAVDDFSLEFRGKTQRIEVLAQQQYIDGLLVLKDGKIVVEEYYGHLKPQLPHLMMSVTKSVVSLLAAVLEDKGVIDLSKPVSAYVPELATSGWGPDSLQTLLDMRDGSAYTEDYEDKNSSVGLQDCALAWSDADYCPEDGPRGGYEFFPTIGRNPHNLGKFVYKSGSTDVMGWVLEAATGEPLAQLISKYIWIPMGAEFDANITVDEAGFVLADGGMNATLRDLGRFGLLAMTGGKAMGRQVVPSAFIDDIRNQAGDPNWPYDDEPEAWSPYYRSFWWGQGDEDKEFQGVGINGQYVQVSSAAGIVVVIFSTWPRANGDADGDTWGRLYELGDALVGRFR